MNPPRWPLTILWPAGLNAACIAGQWRKLSDGRIEATYKDAEELAWCIELTLLVKAPDGQAGLPEQMSMFQVGTQHNYQEV